MECKRKPGCAADPIKVLQVANDESTAGIRYCGDEFYFPGQSPIGAKPIHKNARQEDIEQFFQGIGIGIVSDGGCEKEGNRIPKCAAHVCILWEAVVEIRIPPRKLSGV